MAGKCVASCRMIVGDAQIVFGLCCRGCHHRNLMGRTGSGGPGCIQGGSGGRRWERISEPQQPPSPHHCPADDSTPWGPGRNPEEESRCPSAAVGSTEWGGAWLAKGRHPCGGPRTAGCVLWPVMLAPCLVTCFLTSQCYKPTLTLSICQGSVDCRLPGGSSKKRHEDKGIRGDCGK